jgi:hypothetical protein
VLRNPEKFAKRWKWSDALLRDVTTPAAPARSEWMALYDARRSSRPTAVTFRMPDFTIAPLDGHEIRSLTGLKARNSAH